MFNRDILIWDLKMGVWKYILEYFCNIMDVKIVDFKIMVIIIEDKVVYLWDMICLEKRGYKEKFNIGNNVWYIFLLYRILCCYKN